MLCVAVDEDKDSIDEAIKTFKLEIMEAKGTEVQIWLIATKVDLRNDEETDCITKE